MNSLDFKIKFGTLKIWKQLLVVVCIVTPVKSNADLIEDPSEDVVVPGVTGKAGSANPPQGDGLINDDSQRRPSSKSQEKQKQNDSSQTAKPNVTEQKPAGESKRPDKGDRNRNPDAPVKFESLTANGSKDGGVIVLEKEVLVTQDDLKITAEKATIKVNPATNEVIEVIAVGNVHFSRRDPETGQPVTSDSKEAVFNNSNRTVVLKGDPKLMRGTDVVKGKQIIYDLNTGWVKATRVEGVVQPTKKQVEGKDKEKDKDKDAKKPAVNEDGILPAKPVVTSTPGDGSGLMDGEK